MGVGVRPPQIGPAPGLVQRQYVNLAAGAVLRIDPQHREVRSLIVSVTLGVLDVWLGDHTDGSSGDPDWRFTPQGPQQIWLPANDYVFTVVANASRPQSRGVIMLLG